VAPKICFDEFARRAAVQQEQQEMREAQGLRMKELRGLAAALPIVIFVTAIRAAAQRFRRSQRMGAVGTVRSA
jgi:hypothetical protein